MVRHPSRNYVCHPRNLSHNTTTISDAASNFWDAILNIHNVSDWEHIRKRRQLRINHNNQRENMRRNNHQYKVGDNILIKRTKNSNRGL